MNEAKQAQRWTVPDSESGIRLDKFLAQSGGVSRRIARTWISAGRVFIKGRPIKILTKPLRGGTVVVLESPKKQAAVTKTPPRQELPLLHMDREIVIVNKPANLLSESDRFGAPCLESLLARQLENLGEPNALWLVHRLDAGTSGVIVLARTPRAARSLSAAFRETRVKKTYFALAKGYMRKGQHIDSPIGRLKGTKHGVKAGGKPSHTQVIPLCSTREATWVKALPSTGRTHQIRVHLASIDMPLFGDRLYGGPGYTPKPPIEPISRAMLHAREIEFPHPKGGAAFRISAGLPDDFTALAELLDLSVPQGDLSS